MPPSTRPPPARRVEVRGSPAREAREVVAFLDRAEQAAGVPLVDESERLRLQAAARDPEAVDDAWARFVAVEHESITGYAGLLDGVGDLAVSHAVERGATAGALADVLATQDPAGDAQVWMRHVSAEDVAAVTASGWAVRRRLGVLGRELADDGVAVDPPHGVRILPYRGETDDDGLVSVLAAAYAGTDDAGWDLAGFRARRSLAWFRTDDLLLAVLEDGTIGGVHWLKRRDEVTGEVYNLAVDPRVQGSGLGPALLAAGLEHLASTGCRDVILWVDLANERAVGLYRRQGFRLRWQDVAFSPAG